MTTGPSASPTVAPAIHAARFAAILPAVGIALAAFIWLNHLNPAFPITDDGVRDQLLMRDCTELGHCHLIGASTSVSGFHQGAAWLDLLIAVRMLGGDTSTQRTVVLALLALAVATLFVVVWRWIRPSVALPAAVFLMVALSVDKYPSQLINPSCSAFFDVFTAAGLVCYGLSGRRRFLMLAAFVLGVGINVHVGSLSLVPSLVILAAVGGPLPWRSVLAAVGVLGATYFVTSRAALLANLIGLARDARLLPLVAGGLLITVASIGLGSRFRRCSWDGRAWLVALVLLFPFGIASMWLVLWQRHHFSITYLHPVLGPAAALAGVLVCTPFEIGARRNSALRWVPSAAALGGVVFVAFAMLGPGARAALRDGAPTAASPPAEARGWALGEARVIADQAVRDGWSYESLVFHVQSSACRELLVGMSVSAPPPAPGGSPDRRQLQVVKVSDDASVSLADSGRVVPLEHGNAAVMRDIQSWLDPEALVACRQPIDRPPVCSAATHRSLDLLTPGHFLFVTRSYPEIHSLELPQPYIASYRIPLLPVAGETRDLVLAERAVPGCASWRITRVEGVEVDDQLPADRVRLQATSGSPGAVILEKPFGVMACDSQPIDMHYPPCVFEMSPGDPLQAVVAAR